MLHASLECITQLKEGVDSMFTQKKEDIYLIGVTDIEKRVIIQALVDLKDKQKSLNKNFDFIDSLIIRACDAPQVQGKSRLKYETR